MNLFQMNWEPEESHVTKMEAMQQTMVVAAAMGHREVSWNFVVKILSQEVLYYCNFIKLTFCSNTPI